MSTATPTTSAPASINGHLVIVDGRQVTEAELLKMVMDKPVSEKVEAMKQLLIDREGELRDLLPDFMKDQTTRLIKRARLTFAESDKLQKCTAGSFIRTVLKAGECGFAVDGKLCHAVPYKKSVPKKKDPKSGKVLEWEDVWEAQCQFDYKGMIALARRLKLIKDCWARNVFENDVFEFEERNGVVDYRYKFALGIQGVQLGSFAVATLPEGTRFEWMPLDDIYNIRGRSMSWTGGKKKRRGQEEEHSGPWVTDHGEMSKKCPIKRLLKTLTDDPGMIRMLEIDDEDTDLSITPDDGESSSSGTRLTDIRHRVKEARQVIPLSSPAPAVNTDDGTEVEEDDTDDYDPGASDEYERIAPQSDNLTPMQKYKLDMLDAKTEESAHAFHQKWFGQDSTVEFTAEETEEANKILEDTLHGLASDSERRLKLLKEKIMSYKQPGRLDALERDLNASRDYNEGEKLQAQTWIKQRRSQLTGELPLSP